MLGSHHSGRRTTERRAQRSEETPMPFVNIRIYEGWDKAKLDEIAKGVTDAIVGVTKVPREIVWVVVEEVDPPLWYAGGKPGERMKK
jgi:phenylpyruvate tautomerase PptA (4-oxalocrotonate tautomerase family)